MGKRRYDDLRNEILLTRRLEQILRDRNLTGNEIEMWKMDRKRYLRKRILKINIDFPDPLAKPVTEEWRTVYNECGEGGKDYMILPYTSGNREWSDDDIKEYIMSQVGYPPIYSPYDCTGKRFTEWVSWSRQPVGIVMIHSWGVDV